MPKKISSIINKKPKGNPTIYAYKDTNPQYKGLLKVGYTTVDAASRVKDQYGPIRPGPLPYKIVLEESAMLSDGSNFIDKDVHKMLDRMNISNPAGEWYECEIDDVKSAIVQLRTGQSFSKERNNFFNII